VTLGEREQDAIRAVLDGLEREVDVKLELGPTATPVTLLAAGGREIDSNAVARDIVCDRVARLKSSNRKRSTTVRPVRPALRIRLVMRSTRLTMTASTSAADIVLPARPNARCAPTERRRTPVTTRRRSMLRDNANS